MRTFFFVWKKKLLPSESLTPPRSSSRNRNPPSGSCLASCATGAGSRVECSSPCRRTMTGQTHEYMTMSITLACDIIMITHCIVRSDYSDSLRFPESRNFSMDRYVFRTVARDRVKQFRAREFLTDSAPGQLRWPTIALIGTTPVHIGRPSNGLARFASDRVLLRIALAPVIKRFKCSHKTCGLAMHSGLTVTFVTLRGLHTL